MTRTLTLDLPLCATDITACQRCGTEVELQHTVRTLNRVRYCLGCVVVAVELHHLSAATDITLDELPY